MKCLIVDKLKYCSIHYLKNTPRPTSKPALGDILFSSDDDLWSFYGSFCTAIEWISKKEQRNVFIKFLNEKRAIVLFDQQKKQLRHVDMKHAAGNQLNVHLSADKNMKAVCIRLPKEYDLVSTARCWGPFHKSSYERFSLYKFVEPVLN